MRNIIRKFTIDENVLQDTNNPAVVTVGVSSRHIHLCRRDLDALFGDDYQLSVRNKLSQPGQFAALETLSVIGTKGIIENVRILGPLRPETQVEIAETEARQVGIEALMRHSGDLEGTFGCVLLGPNGYTTIDRGVICAATHLHLHTAEAAPLGLSDRDRVDIFIRSAQKAGCVFDVPVRVGEMHAKDLHIDTDEANAFKVDAATRALVLLNENNRLM